MLVGIHGRVAVTVQTPTNELYRAVKLSRCKKWPPTVTKLAFIIVPYFVISSLPTKKKILNCVKQHKIMSINIFCSNEISLNVNEASAISELVAIRQNIRTLRYRYNGVRLQADYAEVITH